MATATPLPSGARSEHKDLSHWMERVRKEVEKFRSAPEPDTVHDLRVAIRRCRSVASVMREIDTDSAWHEMRKSAKKLFHGLGDLRDAEVMDEWVKKLGPEGDPVRARLETEFSSNEAKLREEALRFAEKFDEKDWSRLERHLRGRARLVPPGSLAAECLVLERLEAAKELHTRALRTDKSKPWHELRIGLKRFRYTVEHLLPEQYAAWSDNLKRIQDLLGEVHDLDVLSCLVKKAEAVESEDSHESWQETIARERKERIQTYRRLTLGKTSLWHEWRNGLPHGDRLEAASMARLRVTARAVDRHPRRTSQVARIAAALFDGLHHVEAAPLFAESSARRLLRAAVRLHGIGSGVGRKPPQKAARKFLLKLPVPAGWSPEEWILLTWIVRYHRGPEPNEKNGGYSKLSRQEKVQVRTIAGILRLARALRKCGAESGSSALRTEKSADAILLRFPGLTDSAESAARVAAAKHLLEADLEKPLILQPIAKAQRVVTLAPQPQPTQELAEVVTGD